MIHHPSNPASPPQSGVHDTAPRWSMRLRPTTRHDSTYVFFNVFVRQSSTTAHVWVSEVRICTHHGFFLQATSVVAYSLLSYALARLLGSIGTTDFLACCARTLLDEVARVLDAHVLSAFPSWRCLLALKDVDSGGTDDYAHRLTGWPTCISFMCWLSRCWFSNLLYVYLFQVVLNPLLLQEFRIYQLVAAWV
jgi:hypothetical protein